MGLRVQRYLILLIIALTGYLTAVAGQSSFLSPNAILNDNLDTVPDGPYAVGHRQVSHFDPNGISANEPNSFFGFAFPFPTQINGAGRQTGYDDFYPVLPQNIHPRTPLSNLWGIPSVLWQKYNMTMPYEGVRLASDQSHPVLIVPNGFWDISLEYMRWGRKLASYGVYVRHIQYHGGDYTFNALTQRNVILTQRTNDVNFGIQMLLAENNDPSSPIYGLIDTDSIGCMGHSYGGSACLAANIGNAEYGISPNPLVQHLILLDPSGAPFEYAADLAKLNVPLLGLYAQADLSEQGIIRIRNANVNDFNSALFTPDSVHQMNQVNDCALSLLAIQTGAVANSFGWAFPGHMYAHYCAPATLTPGDTAPFAALQDFYNIQSFWMRAYVKAAMNEHNPLESFIYRRQFRVQSVEALQRTNLLAPFVYLGPQKCGNLTWVSVTTPLAVQRGDDFYHPGSSSISYSDAYIENPIVFTDCAAVCPFWGIAGTYSNGNASIALIQPSLTLLESDPTCNCPPPFGC